MLQAFECGKGEVMCWMKCRPAVSEPNCHDVKCWDVNENEQCDPKLQIPGSHPMQVNCAPKCFDSAAKSNDFCGGFGVAMFMTGFEFAGDPQNNCVVLFFESWVEEN